MIEKEEWMRLYGWKYSEPVSAYERRCRIEETGKITLDDFIAECGRYEKKDLETITEVWKKLNGLLEENRIKWREMFNFAAYGWCLKHPEAITAYHTGKNMWVVNNCDTKINYEEAIVKINWEFGFEASRIEIVEQPYYESSDWQYIRFNVAGRAYLWAEEDLHQIWR